MNPVFIAVLVLGVLIFADKKFKRVLGYAFILNLIISLINMQFDFFLGVLIFFFGCVVFTAIAYVCIKKTETGEIRRRRAGLLVPLVSIPVLYLAFSFYGIAAAILYTLLGYSVLCILFETNLLRYLFIFNYLRGILMLMSDYLGAAPLFGGVGIEVLIELASILPIALLAFLTVLLYKKYRSLGIWHIWE